MICPHCGHAINNGVNGPVDVVPTFVNLANNGCNPVLNTWISTLLNPNGQPWTNTVCCAAQPIAAAAAQHITIKFP